MADMVMSTFGSSSTTRILGFSGTIFEPTGDRPQAVQQLSIFRCTSRKKVYCREHKKRQAEACLGGNCRGLALRDAAQLSRHEVIGRPRTADGELAILQLPGGAGVAVLVLLDLIVIDEVGNIDEHAAGIHFLAAHFRVQRME